MSHRPTRVTAALACLGAGVCLVTAPVSAQAAQPLKHTVYKGEGGQAGVATTVRFTLKVGKSVGSFTKATVDVSCPTASNKLVFKNVKVNEDGFFMDQISYPGTTVARFQLDGQVRSRHKITVEFSTADSSEPCGNYVMEGTAKD